MLKFSSSTNSILSSSPCSQPGIQLNDLWWAWSTLPSMPSANGFQRASARILPCGNKSGDNANLPCIWLGINRKGSRAKLRLWEQGWTVVRVNAGCKGCVKPSTSLKEENKIIFKISHEAKNLYKQLAKTPVQALPKAWHISKGFYSKGFAVGVPIAEDSCKPNPCRLDIKTLQGKKKKKSMISGCMLHISMSPQMCKIQWSRTACHLSLPTRHWCWLHFQTLPFPASHSVSFVQWGRPSTAWFGKSKVLTYSGTGRGERQPGQSDGML